MNWKYLILNNLEIKCFFLFLATFCLKFVHILYIVFSQMATDVFLIGKYFVRSIYHQNIIKKLEHRVLNWYLSRYIWICRLGASKA